MRDETVRDRAMRAVESALQDADLEWQRLSPYAVMVTLPGTRKLQTPCRLDIGDHALAVHAFVARRPDENHQAVYRWLLERNLKLYGVAFAVDHNGDIYLDGRVPLQSVDAAEVDRLLGSVLSYADESFNTILELGFATSIRREWEWRLSRGESTRNLEAFRALRPRGS